MRKCLLIVVILAFTATEADARRRGHRHHHRGHNFYVIQPGSPGWQGPRVGGRYAIRRPRDPSRGEQLVPPGWQGLYQGPRIGERYTTGQFIDRPSGGGLVPPDWQLQPPDSRWQGRRFMSPDGQSWLDAYVAPAAKDTRAAHLKEVVFVEGEEITYLQGGRDWVVVSGYHGDRIFYRKAVLACAGKLWRHIAFDYPAQAKRAFDQLVTRVSRALEAYAVDENCGAELSSR